MASQAAILPRPGRIASIDAPIQPVTKPTDKRILHIPRRFVAEEWGGTETVILEISCQQQRAGWEPEIFTSLALSKVKSETFAGIPVRRFKYCYPFFGLSDAEKTLLDKKGGSLIAPALFGALLRAKNVRLFHAHTMARLCGQVRTAARVRKKPYVLSVHGGAFDNPVTELKSMAQPTSGKLEWGKAIGALLGSRRVLEDADHIICIGQAELDEARKKISHDRLSYLPNGVDPAKFARGDGSAFRRKHGIPASAFLVVNISRIDAQKNQLALLEAFARLHARQPDSFLLFMGPETQAEYADTLRNYVREHKLESAVKLAPGVRTDDPDLVNAYHACDVFALPSIHEPFGIVVLEAWSATKPVVVSHAGGLKTFVKQDETGLFFDPQAANSVRQLADNLELLMAQPLLRQRLGEAGLQQVKTRYDWSVIGASLESIYQAAERHVFDRKSRKQ
jgi:glycosyltransferase involved in cell wall biosynthesis